MVIEDNQVRAAIGNRLRQLDELATPQAGRRVGMIAQLDHFANDLGPGGLDEPLHLVERPLFAALVAGVEDRDEKRPLGSDLQFFAFEIRQEWG